MSLSKKLAFNTSVQLVGKILSTALGLAAIALLGRYLGPERFGWYTTAITFLQFAGILVDFGLIPVTAQMLGEGRHKQEVLLPNLLGYRFVTAGVFFLLAPLASLLFPYPPLVKWAIALMAISFVATALNQVLTGFYQYRLRMHIVVLGEVAGRIALVAATWLLITFGAGFLPLMAAVAGSSLIFTIVLWWQARREQPAGLAFSGPIWREVTLKMWPIAVSIIFNVVYLKGDTLLLSVFRSQTEVGWYGAAYRVIDILSQLAMMIMGVMLPLLAASWAKHDEREFSERYQQSFNVLMLIGIPIAVGASLLAPRVLTVVFGPEFAPAGPMLGLLSWAVLGVFVGAVFGHTAVAINRQKATMWIYISNAIITLAGYLWAIPRFGWLGAAALTVFSEWYAGLLLAFTVSRLLPTHLSLKPVSKTIAAALLMGLVLWLTNTWPLALTIILSGVTYAVAIVGLGVIKLSTIRELFSRSQ